MKAKHWMVNIFLWTLFFINIVWTLSAYATECTVNEETGPSACPTSFWPAIHCPMNNDIIHCEGQALGTQCCSQDGQLKNIECIPDSCQQNGRGCGYSQCHLSDADE